MTKLPFAITLEVGSSHANRTGSWRVERPVYVDRLPPCNNACPAGENIQKWLYDAESGSYETAWRQLVVDNPFPAIMGRICYHPCESACNRAQVDEAVGINAIERFLGDLAIERRWSLPSPGAETNKRVLVVGAGPSGLSVAYHLRQLGHQVQLVDASEKLGGMMRYGIPAYRLPRDVLDAEIDRVIALGVEVKLNHTVHDIERERHDGGFDAVYLGVGAQLAKRVAIPSGDSARILDAVSYLHQVADDNPPQLGRRVVVYGGGDTALDAARTARRLDASEAVIVYRRTREQMPAHDEELEEALKEGITVRWLSTISNFEGGHLTVEKMRLNDEGFPEATGEYEVLGADAVVLALGQDSDLSLLDHVADIAIDDGVVGVSTSMSATSDGIFAGGDAVPSERTATIAIGHGKRAAHGIDDYLAGHDTVDRPRHELATFERLNTWYYSDAERTRRPELEIARRQDNFEEIVGALTEDNALFEARRCLSCGNCFECDNCYGVCPDNAVIKLGGSERYEFNYDFCKGCGICVSECPCGAIEMVPEQI
ncbi:MAG: NAD(P)-binding protein [Acidimicrobiales bacterium]|jgi:2-oxoacid:acceptor oxidoreductase delta subunit (pyruvate/2-ketoisovalerate family)